MSNANKEYKLINIASHKSGYEPLKEKDFFPIKDIIYPDVGSHIGSNGEAYTHLDLPSFFLYSTNEQSGVESGGDKVKKKLLDAIEEIRESQKTTKVTLITVVNEDADGNVDSAKFTRKKTIELEDATIHRCDNTGGYKISADKAVMGTGKDASRKVEIDYQNKTVK